MGSKQWTAVVQLVTGPLVLVWLGWAWLAGSLGESPAALAQSLLWATGAVVVINIVAMILVAIGVSVARREEYRDEPADERDDVIDARASRIGYAVTSVLATMTLFPVAFGADPRLAVALLFLAPMAGGLSHAAAVLVFYRVN